LHTDISSIILDGTDNSVQITDPDLSIDLGAIAKGYVAQKVSELLVSLGYKDHLINLGGNVLALGNKSDGTKWSALIEDPLADERKWESNVVELSDQTLVTSGSYQRFFTVDGKKYSHIISNSDGMPPELFVSVSILAPASLSYLSDALSTALFCMDIESGKRLIASVNGVDAVWLYSDGTVVSTIDEVGE
jgi:thiamine biosynthesis lipoprotein